jgi:hypothetical protein
VGRERGFLIVGALLVGCTPSSPPVDFLDAASSDDGGLDAPDTSPTDAPSAGRTNDCTDSDYAANDHTAAADPRVITLPVGVDAAPYSPRCMRVRVGQTITWEGDLPDHPLELQFFPSDPSVADADVVNQLGAADGAASIETASYGVPGILAFQCQIYPDVMYGAVEIVK